MPTPTPTPTPGGPTYTPTPTPTAPAGNLVAGRIATTSAAFLNISRVTDGDKNTANYADSYPNDNLQWIQLDIGVSYNLNDIKIWHYFGDTRSYHDVIVRLSNTADFSSGVTTVFNNDTNNSAGLGTGTNAEYTETSGGKDISFSPVNARYVRLYSNGSTANGSNHYVEVEVYATNGTPTPTPTPTAIPVIYEMEILTVSGISSGDTHTVTSDTNMSGGQGDLFNGNATNDYIQYTVNVATAGTYNLKVKVNKYKDRGKYQLAIDGVNQGAVQDNYSSSSTYVELDLGNVTFSAAGDKLFRFKCTGKLNKSTGYKLFTDYLKLIKQ